jgi:hypothetical protein
MGDEPRQDLHADNLSANPTPCQAQETGGDGVEFARPLRRRHPSRVHSVVRFASLTALVVTSVAALACTRARRDPLPATFDAAGPRSAEADAAPDPRSGELSPSLSAPNEGAAPDDLAQNPVPEAGPLRVETTVEVDDPSDPGSGRIWKAWLTDGATRQLLGVGDAWDPGASPPLTARLTGNRIHLDYNGWSHPSNWNGVFSADLTARPLARVRQEATYGFRFDSCPYERVRWQWATLTGSVELRCREAPR